MHHLLHVLVDELRTMRRDEGLIIFFLIVPLLYPLAYSWIYNNEVVRQVPVVVVDDSRSELSRRFVRQCDATPDVAIVGHASDMIEAREMLSQQRANGIYYLPSDFAVRVNRGEQAVVRVYCDMTTMLNYKAIYQSAMAVSMQMNAQISVARMGNVTSREDQLAARPLAFSDVAMFNPAGGYGSFILPAVLMLILQQTLALGVGLTAGTRRERNPQRLPVSTACIGRPSWAVVGGQALAYVLVYSLVAVYLATVVPALFSFVTIGRALDVLAVMLPFVLAAVFFAMTVARFVPRREDVLLIVVFASVPLLLLSGVSWPQSNMPVFWQVVSWLFPSTFAIRGYVMVNSMGATAAEVATECLALWIQAVVYALVAWGFCRKDLGKK